MKKVLIVDDSRLFRGYLRQILESNYLIVGEADDGNSGFELYKSTNPDMVLLDVTMPNCSGIECLEKILNFNDSANVIMVSSVSDISLVEECIKIGAKGYINKNNIRAFNSQQNKNVLEQLEKISGV